MVKISQHKKIAFSMLEACITMFMVAVFTAAATNIFTQKHQKVAHTTSHGAFECYYNEEGALCQRSASEGIYQNPTCGIVECSFRPSRAAEYFVVNAIGGGGGGNTAGLGGTSGEYRTFFIPSIAKELRIVPGVAGLAGSSPTAGSNTEVRNTDGEILLIAYGGKAGFVNTTSYINTIKAEEIFSCSLYFEDGSTALETCAEKGTNPSCSVGTSSITANYCRAITSRSLPTNSDLFFDLDDNLYFADSSMRTTANGVKMYLYVRDEVLNFNDTVNEDPSKLNEYLDAAQLGDDIDVRDAGTGGRGGASAENGKSGAVLIVW